MISSGIDETIDIYLKFFALSEISPCLPRVLEDKEVQKRKCKNEKLFLVTETNKIEEVTLDPKLGNYEQDFDGGRSPSSQNLEDGEDQEFRAARNLNIRS